ncbi:MAG TPA: SpoIIE family protein phosphatase [Anaerolineaceae bacterium]|nr:SpoIIE family protein phosphatase [Anaerolineaceae bacterium]
MNKWLSRIRRLFSSETSAYIPVTGQTAAALSPLEYGMEIAADDPIVEYFEKNPNAVELSRLNFSSPTLNRLREAGIALVVPLVSQGEFVGLLNMGPRLSQQDYSHDDRMLLNNLATQVAPALRIAQLVHHQQTQALQRQGLEHELRIARHIQQTLLPKELPRMEGWELHAHYQPAQAVGGDFYDFFRFQDGRIGLVIGDVTDKGIPAAMVMATTRALLRSVAFRVIEPGMVLERTNDLLCPDIPQTMFVTCLYAVLDPVSGYLKYANAGHNLPLRRIDGRIEKLYATGMPLGLMTHMQYEQKETMIRPGERILFYSDGLIEAHNSDHEMYGSKRLEELLAREEFGRYHPREAIARLLFELKSFTGNQTKQEDDVTLLSLHRTDYLQMTDDGTSPRKVSMSEQEGQVVAQFTIASEPGNERAAMRRIGEEAQPYLPPMKLEQLKTAVAEATLNAIEHGNHNQPELDVAIQLVVTDRELTVRISDHGGDQVIPEVTTPNLERKLAGLESPRGWGLFLIRNLVDEVRITNQSDRHTMELVMKRQE